MRSTEDRKKNRTKTETFPFLASKIGDFYFFYGQFTFKWRELLLLTQGDEGNVWFMNNKLPGKMSVFQPTSTFCCYDNRMLSILLKENMRIWGGGL